MGSSAKILVQLDTDPHASVFDAVVALDAGVDHLLQYGGVTPKTVVNLVHGAIFTRGGSDLANTALFIGGSEVAAGEAVLRAVSASFFGPVRVSVMLDPNGANTTAAAAVLVARRELDLSATTALVLAATGPVGQRAVRMLGRMGAAVRVASRDLHRAQGVCNRIADLAPEMAARLVPVAASSREQTLQALGGVQLVISAGAAGVGLTSLPDLVSIGGIKLAIDLNAVPPLGIDGITSTDRGTRQADILLFGALGVGSVKMKLHRLAIGRLFTSNNLILDADEILELGIGS